VVGFAMSDRITRELVLEALRCALAKRPGVRDLIHHSDRGSQYASHDYRRALEQEGITCSMSRRGNCWDNAVAESFFGRLKVELIHERPWTTRAIPRLTRWSRDETPRTDAGCRRAEPVRSWATRARRRSWRPSAGPRRPAP
jgi:transposase InsO family protein